MRIADIIDRFRHFSSRDFDAREGNYSCGNLRLLPNVDKRTRWDFHDCLGEISRLAKSTREPMAGDCPAFELLKKLSIRHSNVEVPLTYLEIFYGYHAWSTICRYYDLEEKAAVENFFSMNYPRLQGQYVTLINEAAATLSTWALLDALELAESVAGFQRLLDVPVYSLPKDDLDAVIDTAEKYLEAEKQADKVVDSLIDDGIKYYTDALRTPWREIRLFDQDAIISRAPELGNYVSRRRYIALRDSALGLKYLLEPDKSSVWGKPEEDFTFRFTWNSSIVRQWCISGNADLNNLFSITTVADFVEVANTCCTSDLPSDFCTQLKGNAADGIALWGFGPFLDVMNTFRVTEWKIEDPLHAMALMHFILPFVVGGLQSLRMVEAAALLGKYLPRMRALLTTFAGCNLEFANQLSRRIDEQDQPNVSLGTAFHAFNSIRQFSGLVDTSSIDAWLKTHNGVLDAKVLQLSRMHVFIQETLSEMSDVLNREFANSYYRRYGFIVVDEFCAHLSPLSKSTFSTKQKLSPDPRWAEVTQEKLGISSGFESIYTKLISLPSWSSQILPDIESEADKILNDIRLGDNQNKSLPTTLLLRVRSMAAPEVIRALVARNVVCWCALYPMSKAEAASLLGHNVPASRRPRRTKEQIETAKKSGAEKPKDTMAHFTDSLNGWGLVGLDLKNFARGGDYGGWNDHEVRYARKRLRKDDHGPAVET